MSDLTFHNADPAHTNFQYLEDLSTAYWFSETLFAAIELQIFDVIEKKFPTTPELAGAASCHEDELGRMLMVLGRMELITMVDGRWLNSQIVRTYLTSESSSYMGNFLLYRRYMQSGWKSLIQKVSKNPTQENPSSSESEYSQKTFAYVQAMDQLSRQKAKEILRIVDTDAWQTPILDLGGGGGALGRAFIESKVDSSGRSPDSSCHTDLLELTEVIKAAKDIYTNMNDWRHVNLIAADFRHYQSDKKYGLIILGNFLHAYSREEAKELLDKALTMLSPQGLLLIHDYFPDRIGQSPVKGSIYDLTMMINTYNGRCHQSSEIINWLKNSGMTTNQIRDLESDSSVIASVQSTSFSGRLFKPCRKTELQEWIYFARAEGFQRAELLPVSDISIGSWVRKKCQYGCQIYGTNLQCPPNGMASDETEKMFTSYSWAILLEGMPPGKEFHQKLLALEKKAFLSGFHKAFVFSAGHCSLCDKCPEDGVCRFPEKARPSMEGSGIDVYETARNAGINLHPVQEKMQYVKYLGLLMLE